MAALRSLSDLQSSMHVPTASRVQSEIINAIIASEASQSGFLFTSSPYQQVVEFLVIAIMLRQNIFNIGFEVCRVSYHSNKSTASE